MLVLRLRLCCLGFVLAPPFERVVSLRPRHTFACLTNLLCFAALQKISRWAFWIRTKRGLTRGAIPQERLKDEALAGHQSGRNSIPLEERAKVTEHSTRSAQLVMSYFFAPALNLKILDWISWLW